jgi:hypothetical protein
MVQEPFSRTLPIAPVLPLPITGPPFRLRLSVINWFAIGLPLKSAVIKVLRTAMGMIVRALVAPAGTVAVALPLHAESASASRPALQTRIPADLIESVLSRQKTELLVFGRRSA